jgi:ribosomal protein S18 acetylase RimI-like enzyme
MTGARRSGIAATKQELNGHDTLSTAIGRVSRVRNEVTIRTFTTTDQDAVNQVACSAWEQYASSFEGWDRLSAFLVNTASLASDAELIVAERGGQVVGVVGYVGPLRPRETIFPPDWAIIRMLSVMPAERGRGIGRLLTDACIERARRDGATIIGLHTSPVMRSALDLYLRMGFTLQQTIPDRLGVPYAVYTLTLE